MYSRNSICTMSQSMLSFLVTERKFPLMKTPVTKGRLNTFAAKGETASASSGEVNSIRRPSGTSARLVTKRMLAGFGVASA